MKYSNDNAMAMGAVMFGVFCLIIMVAGIVFIVAINNQQTPYADTYGNTLSNDSNTSQSVVTTVTETGSSVMVPLVLIGCAIAVIVIVFLMWAASKNWGR